MRVLVVEDDAPWPALSAKDWRPSITQLTLRPTANRRDTWRWRVTTTFLFWI
jgi:hypothetical protein